MASLNQPNAPVAGLDPSSNLPSKSSTALLRATLSDRTIGALIGSALGDAIGLYTEFLSSAQSSAIYGPDPKFTLFPPSSVSPKFHPDLHRSLHEVGEWTDDTDNALLLLLSFLHSNGSSLPTQKDYAERLSVWVPQGLLALDTLPLGLGGLMGSVVRNKGFVEDPEKFAKVKWEASGRQNAPNGALMRTHPLGCMTIFRTEEEAFELGAVISRTTHVDPRCVVSCVIGTGLVRACIRGEVNSERDVDELIKRGVEWYEKSLETAQKKEEQEDDDGETAWPKLDLDELNRHVGGQVQGLDELKLDERGKIGYTYKTLGSGVVCLRKAIQKVEVEGFAKKDMIFEELITELTMQGGDADTNACFAGAVLGAYLGYSSLPGSWKHGLKYGAWLEGKCRDLCQVLGIMDGEYKGHEDTGVTGGKKLYTQHELDGRWALLAAQATQRMSEAKKLREEGEPSVMSSFAKLFKK